MTKGIDRIVPDRAFRMLTNWHFWMVMAYFALGWVALNNNKINGRQEAQAAARESTCIASIPVLQQLNVHFKGVENLAVHLVQNANRSLRVTPKSAPDYSARLKNRNQLRKDKNKIVVLKTFPVPTEAQCHAQN